MYYRFQRISIIFLLLCHITPAKAAVSFYNQLIDKAEMSLIGGNYKIALLCYDSAFAVKQNPFAQDLYNAGLCALAVKQHDKAFSLCFQLAAKGTGAALFLKKAAYAPLKREKKWASLITYAIKAKKTIQEQNKTANNFLNGLYAINDTIPRWDRKPDMNSKTDKIRLKISDSLTQQLLFFVQKNGYLSEEITGVHMLNDTTLDPQPRFAQIIRKRWLLINSGADPFFKIVLSKYGVQQELLKPDVYLDMTLVASDTKNAALRSFYLWYGCSVYAKKSIKKEEVERFRETSGACNLSDYLKKFVFRIQYPKTDFSINTIGVRQSTPGIEDINDNMRYAKDFDMIVKDVPNCK